MIYLMPVAARRTGSPTVHPTGVLTGVPTTEPTGVPTAVPTGVPVKYWMRASEVGLCLPLCDGTGKGFQIMHWEECTEYSTHCEHLTAQEIQKRQECSAQCLNQCSLEPADFDSVDYKPWINTGEAPMYTDRVPHGSVQWMKCTSNEYVPATCSNGAWEFTQGSCRKSCKSSDLADVFELHGDMHHGESRHVKCKIPQQTEKSQCDGLTHDHVFAECDDGHLSVKVGQCHVPCEHQLIKTTWGAGPIECIEGYELTEAIHCDSWSHKASLMTPRGTEDMSNIADYCKLESKKCQVSTSESLILSNFAKYARFATYRASSDSSLWYKHGEQISVTMFDKESRPTCNNGTWELSPLELEDLEKDFYNKAISYIDRMQNMRFKRGAEGEDDNKLKVHSN